MRPFRHARGARFRAAPRPRRRRSVLCLERLEDRAVPAVISPTALLMASGGVGSAAGSGPPAGLSPAQVRQAYGFNQITFNSGTVQGNGSGQTIAIVDAFNQPNIAGDLRTFDAAFGLPNPQFTVVNENGGSSLPAANQGWGLEISLDVEWAHAIAPGANILLVEAASANSPDLLTAVHYAATQSGVSVVSMSWAAGEFTGEASLDNFFTTPTGHNGVTYVAASGDAGSAGAPNWPSVSANVLAVGGTQLSTDAAGDYLGETGWSGSGGGLSTGVSQPAYQKGVVTQSSTARAVPDVAYDASGGSPFAVYDTSSYGGWLEVYGTSAGAPQWSALIAVADQGRALDGEGALDGGTQTLPMLYQLPASDFHDITSGSNGGYSAGAGYDLVTGRGSPVANLIVAGLVGTSTSPSPSPSPGGPGASSSYEVADFSGRGVWRYSPTAGWQQLTPVDATQTAVDAHGDVAAEFPGYGVLRYEDSTGWRQLTPVDASSLDIAGQGVVAAEFPGYGVFRFEDAAGWRLLTPANSSQVAVDASGDVAAEFPGYGVFRFEDAAGWRLLTPANASHIAIAGNGVVAAEFAGYGVFRFEDAAGWQQLSSANASRVAVNASGDVAAEFVGYGVWRYEDSTGWRQLTGTDAAQVAIAADGDVVGAFSSYGIWIFDSAWTQLTANNASEVGVGA